MEQRSAPPIPDKVSERRGHYIRRGFLGGADPDDPRSPSPPYEVGAQGLELLAGFAVASGGVERQLVAADHMQPEAVALLDLATALLQQQLVPLLHLLLQLAEHVDRLVHLRADERACAVTLHGELDPLPIKEPQVHVRVECGGGDEHGLGDRFAGTRLTAEQQVALHQTETDRAGVLVHADRDRLPQRQPPRVQIRLGQTDGAGQRVAADQTDLGVAGVSWVSGHLDLADLEVGGQGFGAGLQVGAVLAGGHAHP